jgi:preprotein translocase subunit SecD
VAINPRNRGPLRTLAALIVIIFGIYGLLAAVHTWGDAQLTPKLGLDLQGGTQLILQPRIVGNQKPSEGQVLKAVDIIRNRVDSSGVAEAEVTTQGGSNIVVSLPGSPEQNKATIASLQKSSQLRIRAVLVATQTNPTPVVAPTGTATGKPTAPATGKPKITGKPTAPSKATATGGATSAPKSGFPQALAAATPPAPKPKATAAATAPATTAPAVKHTSPSDLTWITPDVKAAFEALNCKDTKVVDEIVDDSAKPMVTCSSDGRTKYVLGPAEVEGPQITDASSGLKPGLNGVPTGEYEVRIDFNGEGKAAFCDMTSRIISLPSPQNESAMVLDNRVLSAPIPEQALCAGKVSVTGSFTAASSKVLADQLKFGALPMSFDLQTQDTITPQVGGDQLRRGLLAGFIGLLLVVAYSLFQYRALGLVTVSSLLIASALTYGAVSLFGWAYGFRLTMAGVAGLIVSIGITADSFIIYFERVRDEVRDGRALHAAVETGWARARRTILISDAVNFLAAAVLYALAASNVQGFAFTLMLTTIIDIVVVFLFTHPLLSILANTKFFGEGHKWSGLDPERLGARTVSYAGRGRVTIAARRAATEGNQS